MSFSHLSKFSNTKAFLKTMATKQTNIRILADVSMPHSIYSIKPSATQRKYTHSERIKNPKNKNPQNALIVIGHLWVD